MLLFFLSYLRVRNQNPLGGLDLLPYVIWCIRSSLRLLLLELNPVCLSGISKEQFGFLEGRQITDAIGVVQEVLHSIKVKNFKALVLKLDLIKAYDRVDWGFLRLVLLQVGLSLEATDWILGCVTSANFVVLINGRPTSFFKSKRGLRQGCPLSPLLFLLVVEGLSRAIQEQVRENNIEGIPVARGLNITHLMFVDDVILFGSGNISEWEVFKEVMDLFCKATWMAFSPQKSSFLEAGWKAEDLALLKELIPFEVKPVEVGFKYLGCFLKPNCYTKADWQWMEKKFEKRISNWSHRWLTLGGRVTLVKVVLESIPVYWLSVEKIPKGILNNIRKRMFSFLWTGKKLKEGLHLISWKKIAKPKKDGGWGIKNIFSFGKALATKNLWRCLMIPGLWHEVIIKKYIKKKIVIEWFREGKKNWNGASNIWRALTSSLAILTDWLVWKPGNGRDIRIGVDPLIGSHTYYKLSRNLISVLKEKGIEFLAQAGTGSMENTRHTSWKKAELLGLDGELREEWNFFLKGLIGSGFELNSDKDTLLWSWDTKGGQVSAKKAYEVQMMETVEVEQNFWYVDLWTWQLPLKVKLFIWLMLEQRILTWENLIKRGFNGPSRCVLCGIAEENVLHLFVKCSFTKRDLG
jgi:hypothetical protein